MAKKKRLAPTRRKLTKRVVVAARPLPKPEGAKYAPDLAIWDTDIKGFGLIVKPGGTKSFVLSYRNQGGAQKRYKLDQWRPGLIVDDVRDLALQIKGRVAKGEDPSTERVQARGQAVEVQTVAELCTDFLENHAKHLKRSWKEDERRLKVIKAELGKLRLERVTKGRVRRFIASIGGQLPGAKNGGHTGEEAEHRPYEANRILILLQTMFNYAIDLGYLPRDFENPARWKRTERYREEARTRILTDDERPKLLEAIEKEPNLYHRALFKLLMITGLRKGEWLGARWSELNAKAGRITLPRTKAGKERIVPLPTAAIEILRALPRCVGNDHIFPAHGANRWSRKVEHKAANLPMSDPKRQWRRIREKAGCEDLRVHDLRRTASNLMLSKGVNPKSVQKALGHADLETTMRHYVTADEDEQRRAVEALAETVLAGDS